MQYVTNLGIILFWKVKERSLEARTLCLLMLYYLKIFIFH